MRSWKFGGSVNQSSPYKVYDVMVNNETQFTQLQNIDIIEYSELLLRKRLAFELRFCI